MSLVITYNPVVQSINLTELPTTILSKIASFGLGADLVHTIAHVCKKWAQHVSSPKKTLKPTDAISVETTIVRQFVTTRCRKLKIHDYTLQFKADLYGMQVTPKKLIIKIDILYLLVEQDIDSFLLQHPKHRKSIHAFLTDNNRNRIVSPAEDLILWFNDNKGAGTVFLTEKNTTTAAEILVMHAIGNLSASKRFQLAHELGHAYDNYWNGKKTLGAFNRRELHFIQPHQFSEVRADLAAAREENLHKEAYAYFEWNSIFAGQPEPDDAHPLDKNRAKAILIDYNHMLKFKQLESLAK